MEALKELVLDLVKSLLQVGYYTADHPQAQKFLKQLYESFVRTLEDRTELTFFRRTAGDTDDVRIDGFYPDQDVSLQDVLPPEVVNVFVPKLLDFFVRKRIVSFSIKSKVSHEDFITFITIMSGSGTEEILRNIRGSATDWFMQKLRDEGVTTISVVMEQDLLYERGKLPWRVELTLARIKRDLTVIPFYSSNKTDQRKLVRDQIIMDVMRPIRDVDYAKDVLLHLDMAAGQGDEVAEEIETAVFAALPDVVRAQALQSIVRLARKQQKATLVSGQSVAARARYLIDTIVHGLRLSTDPVNNMVMRDLYVAKFVEFDDLPPAVQKVLVREDAANRFVNDATEFTNELDSQSDLQAYKEFMKRTLGMLAVLADKEKWLAARQMIFAILDHANEQQSSVAGREVVAAHTLNYLFAKTDFLGFASNAMAKAKTADLDAILDIMKVAGLQAAERLCDQIQTLQTDQLKQKCAELLVGCGKEVLITVVGRLALTDLSESTLVNFIRVIGDVGDPLGATELRELLAHESDAVRSEAFAALTKIPGAMNEEFMIGLLESEHVDLVSAVVDFFIQQKPLPRPVYGHLLKIATTSTDDEVICEILKAIGQCENVEVLPGKTVEILVINWLNNCSSTLNKGKLVTKPLSPKVEEAVCFLLAKLGTAKSVPILTALKKSSSIDVIEQSQSALKYLTKKLKR